MKGHTIIAAGALCVAGICMARAAEIPAVPVPSSPYLPVIYRFADTLIEHGRDVYGPEHTALFLGFIDREALTNRPPWTTETTNSPTSRHETTNPQHFQNLLRLLYTLSELSGRPKYRDAANLHLKWLLNVGPSNAVDLLTRNNWRWDVLSDRPLVDRKSLFYKPGSLSYRPWLLWDQCFAMDPPAAAGIALALVDLRRPAGKRETGFYLRACAVAYRHTTNDHYLKAIDACLTADSGREDNPEEALSLAIDADGAAHHMPPGVAMRLREFATANDKIFCASSGDRKLWGDPWQTRARIGMMAVARYENTGNVSYREFIHTAADSYFSVDPGSVQTVSPMTLGHAISLQLAAWRSTAQPRYLDRARYFGDYALKNIFDAQLPRARRDNNRYEAVSGTDTLALALVELHLNILGITAAQCPPNTIDR